MKLCSAAQFRCRACNLRFRSRQIRASLAEHSGEWLAKVRDPASGFISLRSTVTDIKGDSTVETINRAYGVS